MNRFPVCVFVLALVISCNRNYTPKPDAYYRIDFPEKEYQEYKVAGKFSFDCPVYGQITDLKDGRDSCWLNMQFPEYKGTIYLTYKEIKNNFDNFIEDDWKIVFNKIAQKADAVDPYDFEIPAHNMYGTIYDIKGNAASSVQFFVTDSVKHFLRGSLYFATRPNYDSLAPAINFFKTDVVRLVESLRWTEEGTGIRSKETEMKNKNKTPWDY